MNDTVSSVPTLSPSMDSISPLRPVTLPHKAMAVNLYANNEPMVPLTTEAQKSSDDCLWLIQQLPGDSPIEKWLPALHLVSDVAHVNRTDPNHRSHARHDKNGLRIYDRPLCFKNNATRTTFFNQGLLSSDQKWDEKEHGNMISHWDATYGSTTGLTGLIRSPKDTGRLQALGAPYTTFENIIFQRIADGETSFSAP